MKIFSINKLFKYKKARIKIVHFLFSSIILINFVFPFSIYAQIASQSATPIQDITFTPTPTVDPVLDFVPENSVIPLLEPNASPSAEITPTPLLIDETIPPNSALIESPPKVHQLNKKDYQANEKIELILENNDSENLKLTLTDSQNKQIPVLFDEEKINELTILKINPPDHIKVGRYKLTVVDRYGQVTVQEFTWGVLAINFNKSIYMPDEQANLAMAVLDEQGKMVCDAKLELKIQNPDSKTEILSTENGLIKVNPECLVYDLTVKPDYEAVFQVKSSGNYFVTLIAETINGTYTINDSFEVRDHISIDIERIGPTRIYVPQMYTMNFNIKFNEDFKGEIIETVPESFTIYSDEKYSYTDVKIVNKSKDKSTLSTINLGYPINSEKQITQLFGKEETDPIMKEKYLKYGLVGHDGVDFYIAENTPVLAVDEGEVVLTENGDYGNTIIVRHKWGQSYYGHLNEFKVTVGQKIIKGEELGLSGNTGLLSTGPHLHLGLKLNKNEVNNGYFGKIDPLPFLGETAEISNFSVKQIRWSVDVKSGDQLSLGYQFLAPNISPEFYLLGPLQLIKTDQSISFTESRQWQIAGDASSTVVDGTSNLGTAYSSERKVVRTTNGANGKRTFVIGYTGSALVLYYTDDPDAGSPSWSAVGTLITSTTHFVGDMVWDSSNNVLYIVYGRDIAADGAGNDVYYRRVSSINGSSCNNTSGNCLFGAQQIGNDATNANNYTRPLVAIGGDSGTTKVYVISNYHNNCSTCEAAGFAVDSGTINSDTPTWSDTSAPETNMKTWTAATGAGLKGVTRSNTNSLVVQYSNGTDILATRHLDSSDDITTTAWDTLANADGATTLSADNPIVRGMGSVVGDDDSDVVWFSWLDANNDINTIRWNGSSLDTEMTPVALAASDVGPALSTDYTTVYLFYQDETDGTKLVYQSRSFADGTTAWNGTETTVEDYSENLDYPSVSALVSQSTIDVVYTSETAFLIRHTPVSFSSETATLEKIMRHGKWFNSSGARQPFTF